MHDHKIADNSVLPAEKSKRPLNEAPIVESLRAAPDALEPHLATQLDAWEDEGGTPAPH